MGTSFHTDSNLGKLPKGFVSGEIVFHSHWKLAFQAAAQLTQIWGSKDLFQTEKSYFIFIANLKLKEGVILQSRKM